jgi:hypothetical protein
VCRDKIASVTALNDAIGDGAILAAATLAGIPIVGMRARLHSNEPRNACRQNQETAHGPLPGFHVRLVMATKLQKLLTAGYRDVYSPRPMLSAGASIRGRNDRRSRLQVSVLCLWTGP